MIGRISPAQVLPDNYSLFIQIPNPPRLARKILRHEPLPEVLALAELAPLLPLINQLRNSNLPENRLIEFAARGNFEGVLSIEGPFLGAWDLGLLSPLLRILPLLAGRVSVPDLYYVQGGRFSRFEYRMEDGKVFFVCSYRNLLLISDSVDLIGSILEGRAENGERQDFKSRNFDLAFKFSNDFLKELLSGDDDPVTEVLGFLDFNGPLEAALNIEPRQLDINLYASMSSSQGDFERIISRPSPAPDLMRMVPDNTQYLTLLAAGTLEEILNAASVIPGSDISEPWRRADSASRTLLGLSVNDLMLSWTGSEFAVFGMEGRPSPVILVEIKDERRRQEVFNRAFRSLFVNENIQLNLDGNRLSRIELPAFLSSLFLSMDIRIPSPYYTIHDDYLIISESAESVLAAVNGVRRSSGLLRTEIWRSLAKTDKSSFTLFYSLDRSLPFFLNTNNQITPLLRLYHQGLVQLSFENNEAHLSLSLIPGQGRGLELAPGFPMEISGRTGNQVYFLDQDRNNESRIILTQANSALAINSAELNQMQLEVPGNPGRIWALPSAGIPGAVWVVSPQGRVYLTDRDLEVQQGFPRITALRLTSAPQAWGGRLYLSDFSNNEASIYVMDNRGSLEKWPLSFEAALLSPISFIDFQNRTYAACYPKEFLGSIWMLDNQGNALSGWPVYVSGIAFGSPLLFIFNNRLSVAFITQAGELTVYDEGGRLLPGFPLELDGIFYIQPIFDGEYLWLIASDGTLFRLSFDGTLLSHKIPNLEVMEEGYITAIDVGGQKVIFISGEGNALHGYNRNFQSLEGFPLPIWGKPAFTEFNGKMNISGAGMDNRIYMWQFN